MARITLAVLTGFAFFIVGLFLFLHPPQWVLEQWYVMSFKLGGEASKEIALCRLNKMKSLEVVPLCLSAMEETGTIEGIGGFARIIIADSDSSFYDLALAYPERPGSWSPDRCKQAFKKISPGWHGEFDREGILRFLNSLPSLRVH